MCRPASHHPEQRRNLSNRGHPDLVQKPLTSPRRKRSQRCDQGRRQQGHQGPGNQWDPVWRCVPGQIRHGERNWAALWPAGSSGATGRAHGRPGELQSGDQSLLGLLAKIKCRVVTNAAALRSLLRTMGACTPTGDTGPWVELLRGCKTSLHVLFPIAFLT